MNLSKLFPVLFQQSSKGKMKRWAIWCEDKKTYALIKEEHGYLDGKQTPEEIRIDSGVNIGKKNETTPFEQACSQAQSKWNKKKDKGYVEKNEKQNEQVVLPMLAVNYRDRSHDISFPNAFVQPKLNGIRCIHTDKFQSRLGKFWNTLSHLAYDVKKIQDIVGYALDGECFIEDLNLQDIGALVKKERINEEIEGYKTEDLEYWIFDYIDPITKFSDRHIILKDAFKKVGAVEKDGKLRLNNLVCVPTFICPNDERVLFYHKSFIKDGFEGTIIRNDTPYEIGKRTKNLQKKKDFLDSEYKVIGGKEGIGRDKGCITFRCITKEGLEFDVRPIGTVKERKRWFKDINKITNSMVTIRYQEKTKDNIPFHGRVISVRSYE